MIKKGIDIYGTNTIGMDNAAQKMLPTNNQLTELQRKAGDLVRNSAYRYIGKEGIEVYNKLIEIGSEINALSDDRIQERKSIILDKLRSICRQLKEYNNTLEINAEDTKNVEWSGYKIAKDYAEKSNWYGTPLTDEWYINILKEYKRVKNLFAQCPTARESMNFAGIGNEVIEIFKKKYIM